MSREDELYAEYHRQVMKWEENEEEYLRENRDFKQEEDESRKICEEERHSMEQLLEMWGDCEDSGKLRCDFYDFIEEEKQTLARKEQELAEENKRLMTAREALDTQYQEDKLKNSGEE